jgi:tetratricopeptide (TPR) repeat protein
MRTIALDPSLGVPAGLSHEAAEKEALRVATLERIDRRRVDPLRVPDAIAPSPGFLYRGGLDYRGRPTRVWQSGAESGALRAASTAHHPEPGYFVLGVCARRQAYYAAYRADEAASPGDWIAADWRAYSERERILAVYRRRLDEKPRAAARQYELALTGIALGTAFLTGSRTLALCFPGPLDEFVPAVDAAVEQSPANPKYLALAAFLHERLLEFDRAARLYRAAAAGAKSALYAYLHADALLFAGDAHGAREAAERAARRARSARDRYDFGGHRHSLLEAFKDTLHREVRALRRKVEGLSDAGTDAKTMADAHRRAIKIDPGKVPTAFHDLIPLAKVWGVGDDAARGHQTDHATAQDKTALRKALPPERRGAIQAWLDSLGPEGIADEEAGAFMYLLEGLDEMGI